MIHYSRDVSSELIMHGRSQFEASAAVLVPVCRLVLLDSLAACKLQTTGIGI